VILLSKIIILTNSPKSPLFEKDKMNGFEEVLRDKETKKLFIIY
jgi:hypothetical protein